MTEPLWQGATSRSPTSEDDNPTYSWITGAVLDVPPGTEVEVRLVEPAATTDRSGWLHGWPRNGTRTVLIGSALHCAGCGRLDGVTCVAFPEDWEPPGPEPDWPFPQETCAVCTITDPVPRSTEAAAIVRDLAGPGAIKHLQDLRRRARHWSAQNDTA